MMKTDSEIIAMYLEGDHNKMDILVKKYKTIVYGFIFKKVKCEDTADDLFQETWIKAVKALKKGTYNNQNKFSAWLTQIAANTVIDYFRKVKKIPVYDFNSDDFDFIATVVPEPRLSIEDLNIQNETHEVLRKMVELLPKGQKDVVVLRLWKEHSFQEISESLDINLNTALGRMRYGLINLRKLMNEHKITLTA